MARYIMNLTKEQVPIVSDSLNLLMKMSIGDWYALYDLCQTPSMDSCSPFPPALTKRVDREEFNRIIDVPRAMVFPQLKHGELLNTKDVDIANRATQLLSDVKGKSVLTLEDGNAKLLNGALERYCRLRIGQWAELVDICVPLNRNDYRDIYDDIIPQLMQARKSVYPELFTSWGTSYGVGKFEDADYAWEIHEVLRNKIAWTEHPEGGNGVCFDKPRSFCGHKLASCEVEK